MNESTTKNTSDWNRIAQLEDVDIDTSDIPPLDEKFFQAADWWTPPHLVDVTLQIDADTLAWFKTQQDYTQKINAALRLYAQAHHHYPKA